MNFLSRLTVQKVDEENNLSSTKEQSDNGDGVEGAGGECSHSLDDMDEILSSEGPSQPNMMGLPPSMPKPHRERRTKSALKEYANRLWTKEAAAALFGAVAGGLIGGPVGIVIGSKATIISAPILAATGAGVGNLAMRKYSKNSSEAETSDEKGEPTQERNDPDCNSLQTESDSSVLLAGTRNTRSLSNIRHRDIAAREFELPVSAMPQNPS